MPAPHPLDRPIWSAVTARQANLALGDGRAVRLAPDYGLFAAAADGSPQSLASLAALVPAGGQAALVAAAAPPPGPGSAAVPPSVSPPSAPAPATARRPPPFASS